MTRTLIAAALVSALATGTVQAHDDHDDHGAHDDHGGHGHDHGGHGHGGHGHHGLHGHFLLPPVPLFQPVDRFATVRIVNTTDTVLDFDYRVGNGRWQSMTLAPGQWYLIYANFSLPGSYRHDPIRIRFDEDLRPGHDHFESFLPYVRYSHCLNDGPAFVYHFAYASPSRQFVEMHPAG